MTLRGKNQKDTKMTDTGKTITLGGKTLQVMADEMKFTVPAADKIKPEQAHRAGEQYKVPFEYPQVSNDEEAQAVAAEKEWSLVDFVNDALKSAGRSSAYQSELGLYKINEVSADDIRERMIRDYIRLGFTKENATVAVDTALASLK